MAQPWLISSPEDLGADASMIAEWKARWESSYPKTGSVSEKVKWAKNVETTKPSRRTRSAQKELPHCVGDVLASIVMDASPEDVEICAVVSPDKVHLLAKKCDETKFLASPFRRRCPALDNASGFLGAVLAPVTKLWQRLSKSEFTKPEIFFQWLAKEKALVHDGLLVGSMACKKTDDVHEKLTELTEQLGFEASVIGAGMPLSFDSDLVVESFLFPRDHVGQHIGVDEKIPFYLGVDDDDDDDFKPSPFVANLLKLQKDADDKTYVLIPKEPPKFIDDEEDDDDDEEDDEEEDDEEAEEDEEEKEDEDVEMMEIEDDEEDDTEITAETHEVLWLSTFYDDEYNRVTEHVFAGAGETTKVKAVLSETDKASAQMKLDIFTAELNALKNRFKDDDHKDAKKMCALLALTTAIVWDERWMKKLSENGNLADLVSKKLAGAWRDVLKLDDETLFIGNPAFDDEGDPRAPLSTFLDHCKEFFDHYDFKFNYAPRKRKVAEAPAPPPKKKATSAAKKPRSATRSASSSKDDDDDI